jgi:hypothetical protein
VTGISVEHGTQRLLERRLSVREVLAVKTCGVNVGSFRWRTAAGARYPRVLPRCTVLYFREYPSILELVSRFSLRPLAIFGMSLVFDSNPFYSERMRFTRGQLRSFFY